MGTSGSNLRLLQLRTAPIVLRLQVVEVLLGEGDLRAPGAKRAQRRLDPHYILRDSGLLERKLRLALEHRLKPCRLRLDRRETLDLDDDFIVPQRIVAGRNS